VSRVPVRRALISVYDKTGLVAFAERLVAADVEIVSSGGTAVALTVAGIPAVVCGPGEISEAHQPNEFIARDQLAACDAFLARLVDYVAG